jgi:hypothetical protein
MMPGEVFYQAVEPEKITEYHGKPIMRFGYYKTVLEDGFTMLTGHRGIAGTVGEQPVDLDLNPHFVEGLITDAVLLRERALQKRASHAS